MASQRKDPRRPDLIVPYMEPEKAQDQSDFQSTMSSTLPMAAIFTRNKYLGWTSVVFAVQNWLAETPAQKAAAATPAYLTVGMAVLSLAIGYMPLFMPPPANSPGAGSGTEAPAAIPQ